MIACSRDGWLTDIAGFPCHKLAGEGAAAEVRAALAEAGDGFFFTKIPVSAVANVKNFGAAGFYLVDTNVTLDMAASEHSPRTETGIDVFPARTGDHRAAQEIAESAFAYSRFHLDPFFSVPLANRIKREWTRSYCEGRRGDVLLVAERRGSIVGFLAALTAEIAGRKYAVIDLVAVAAGARGAGAGRALVSGFQSHYFQRVDMLRVGTQIANTPSLGLYRRCGFGVTDATYVLHAQRRNGACI
jgi:ribosomal protein S18 acetylase RimI-like enzyme